MLCLGWDQWPAQKPTLWGEEVEIGQGGKDHREREEEEEKAKARALVHSREVSGRRQPSCFPQGRVEATLEWTGHQEVLWMASPELEHYSVCFGATMCPTARGAAGAGDTPCLRCQVSCRQGAQAENGD